MLRNSAAEIQSNKNCTETQLHRPQDSFGVTKVENERYFTYLKICEQSFDVIYNFVWMVEGLKVRVTLIGVNLR